ncbi:MAG: hypothetical protein ABIO71_00805 [Caldimonas sp.]
MAAALLIMTAPPAGAMGFGRTSVATTLGQPLDFSAAVLLDGDERLERECVSAEVRVGDSRLPAPAVRATLQVAADGKGRTVRIRSSTLIDEPVVTVDVILGCGSRITRRFVTFVDPPLLNLAATPSEVQQPQRSDSQVAPILAAVRATSAVLRPAASGRFDDGSSASPRAGAPTSTARSRRLAAASGSGAATRPAATAQGTDARAGGGGAGRPNGGAAVASAGPRNVPRLRLEAPPPTAVASAPLTAQAGNAPQPVSVAAAPAVPLSPPVAASTPEETASSTLARERERIQVLEAGLARVGRDAQATQKSLAELQARLRQAESDRYANGLVYTLAAGLVLFAGLAAALWALRPRQRRQAQWFDAAAKQQARAQRSASASTSSAPAAAGRETGRAPEPAGSGFADGGPPRLLPVTAPAAIGGLEVTTVLGPEPTRPMPLAAAVSTPPGSTRRAGPLSMEELIDLEQQAEFFVVLGQDEAAIELLGAHIDDGGGVSPLPYLKLLEIHQRRVDRPAYEHVREAFQERFNAYAPDWSSDIHFGRALEEYPQTIARLQALWSTPLHAMQMLDSLLFRRSEADEAFDFPACRELMFLYSVARELAGHVETDFGSIDLFLPLEDAEMWPAAANGDLASMSVDFDVTDEPSDYVIRRPPGRRGAN